MRWPGAASRRGCVPPCVVATTWSRRATARRPPRPRPATAWSRQPPFANHWTPDDIPDRTARTALITGGNGGIGLETARALARHGARVILAGRSQTKLDQAAEAVRTEAPEPIRTRSCSTSPTSPPSATRPPEAPRPRRSTCSSTTRPGLARRAPLARTARGHRQCHRGAVADTAAVATAPLRTLRRRIARASATGRPSRSAAFGTPMAPQALAGASSVSLSVRSAASSRTIRPMIS
ncbi:SDR family NAD(P)-dependent oxidoreductase [Streptomyces flaveolus]|uniref:SDR family NAD(P)-dependent oxidoreductase n=1 Tax=Streptomyces flaveolus TaxID=67297 RepID=UPI00332C0A56